MPGPNAAGRRRRAPGPSPQGTKTLAPKSYGVIEINRFDAGVEINRRRALFLETVAAGFLDAAERGLEGEAGGDLVYFDDAGFDALGVEHCFLQIASDDR